MLSCEQLLIMEYYISLVNASLRFMKLLVVKEAANSADMNDILSTGNTSHLPVPGSQQPLTSDHLAVCCCISMNILLCQ